MRTGLSHAEEGITVAPLNARSSEIRLRWKVAFADIYC